MEIYVQFENSNEEKVIALFAVPQGDDFQNQGVITTADARYKSFYNSIAQDYIKDMLPAPESE